jgi:hypothetical protein
MIANNENGAHTTSALAKKSKFEKEKNICNSFDFLD